MKIEDLEKALQYFIIAVPESEEQAKAYFWARKALTALRSMQEAGEPISLPPAHIDRSKWTAEWVNRMPILGAGDLETRCNSCGNLVLYETDFCPYCGKAMTEEAWAELKRRLRG